MIVSRLPPVFTHKAMARCLAPHGMSTYSKPDMLMVEPQPAMQHLDLQPNRTILLSSRAPRVASQPPPDLDI